MRKSLFILALVLNGCTASVPSEVAAVVLRDQLRQVEAIDEFVACVSVDGNDADERTLELLRTVHRDVVPGSECEWVLDVSKGSVHKPSGRKAMLVNVFRL